MNHLVSYLDEFCERKPRSSAAWVSERNYNYIKESKIGSAELHFVPVPRHEHPERGASIT